MSFSKIAVLSVLSLLSLIAVVCADDAPYGQQQEPMPYDFSYAVKDDYSGNDFGHSESSDGKEVTGEYFVQLPDGRLQKVVYTADHDTGFVADVQYEGEARFDEPQQQQYSN